MSGFREQNRFLIYLVNMSGFYFKSIETLTNRKMVLLFFTIYTKIGMVTIPVYIASSFKFIIFDEPLLTVKVAEFRRLVAFFTSMYKIIFFYVHRKDIENLIDLWDSFFKEDFYTENRQEKLKKNQKQVIIYLSFAWLLNFIGGLVYTLPPFFNNTKKLNHPSGIPYREQSPDYELMATFHFLKVVMGSVALVGSDCILMVFLSLVVVQLTHLEDCLSDMVGKISLDDQGYVVYRTRQKQINAGDRDAQSSFVTLANGVPDLDDTFKFKNSFLGATENNSQYRETLNNFDEKIRIWILHHQQTIRFFHELNRLFSPLATVHLIYVIFYTCFTAFHLVRVRFGIDLFVTPFIASGSVVTLFIVCYFGVQAEIASAELFKEAFGRSWFLYPKKIKTCFLFIAMRGQKPLSLRGISLFIINLSTFFQVIKITYQLFAFLLQVYKE